MGLDTTTEDVATGVLLATTGVLDVETGAGASVVLVDAAEVGRGNQVKECHPQLFE